MWLHSNFPYGGSLNLRLRCGTLVFFLSAVTCSAGALGSFTFSDPLFGDSFTESDGGILRNSNWLNVFNVNPGIPGALTGPDFNTGIANVAPSVFYTIHYGIPIVNGSGDDLGIVAARFNPDNFLLAVSSDGSTFTGFQTFVSGSAIGTGVTKDYFFNGGGPFVAGLYVYPVDLSLFGLAPGATISAVRITSELEGDLIRVAGFEQAPPQPEVVPEPGGLSLLACGLLFLGLSSQQARRRIVRLARRPG
jgi:hypothetical protein